jgi:hypothetical protein
MHGRTALIAILLMAAQGMARISAAEVTTYGSGLRSCDAYLQAQQREDAEEMSFIDWLSGYMSGANEIALRKNDFLGNKDLKQAMYWLDAYCRAHGDLRFAEATYMFIIGASGSARHAAEVTTYGSGLKSCAAYLSARKQSDSDALAFIDWLGGYMSGANALSLRTGDVLGVTDLKGALGKLDTLCDANRSLPFASAAGQLTDAGRGPLN